ncbi:MAG: hypothetical protein E6K92_10090 [Thaumarchaeota archaeon]|nr:MAG: hypothetical protein E6K92_10090 [Nitrososphaerota archaeon]
MFVDYGREAPVGLLSRLTVTLDTDMTKIQKVLKLCGLSTIAALTAIAAYSATASMNHAAFAAKPNNQACLGHDFSGYAKGGSLFGDFISFLATFTQGIGNEIQAHLAGLVPDSTIPNSCNN